MKLRSVRYRPWLSFALATFGGVVGFIGSGLLYSNYLFDDFWICLVTTLSFIAGGAAGAAMSEPSSDEEATYRLTGKYE